MVRDLRKLIKKEMSNDFKKKELTKGERMLYELAMQMHDLDQRVWSTSSHLLAMGILLGIDPKKMAELLTGEESVLREYAQKISDEIKKIQESKPKSGEEPSSNEHNHSDSELESQSADTPDKPQ